MHLGEVRPAQRQLFAHRGFLLAHQALEFDAAVQDAAAMHLLGIGCRGIGQNRLAGVVGVEFGGRDHGAGLALARADAPEGVDGLLDLQPGSS